MLATLGAIGPAGGADAYGARWELQAALTGARGELRAALTAGHPDAGLHVIPFPGTPDASPQSDIIFSSLRPSEIRTVTVSGSQSGLHPGRLRNLPAGAGTAFVPSRPFTPGEQVIVRARLSSAAAGAASGDPGAITMRFSFTVSVATRWHGPIMKKARLHVATANETPTQTFRSRPGLHPPVIAASADPDARSGDIFLTPVSFHVGSAQAGPMILDSKGRLVWFRPVHGFATNLEVQLYHGDPALTWWQRGRSVEGEDVIVGRSYRTIAVMHAGYGYVADIHEFQLTPQGTALIDAYTPVRADLSSVGGPRRGSLMDCVIQELDVKTGRVLWEWHALGHVPLTDAYLGSPTTGIPYDYFHLNSIQLLPSGNLLVSARNTWGVYEIDKQTGKVIWTLGGKHSSFTIGRGAGFEWQHDARLQSDGTLTVFDDASGSGSQEETQSSAKVIRLNMTRLTATLVGRYEHSPPLITRAEGSAQIIPSGNVFVGWGDQPVFSEYAPGGRQIFTGSLPLGIRSYRALRFPWNGTPRSRPTFALAPQSNGALKLYASWNGATRVASWRALAGAQRGALVPVANERRAGFETVITLRRQPRYVAVAAMGADGKVLGISKTRVAGA